MAESHNLGTSNTMGDEHDRLLGQQPAGRLQTKGVSVSHGGMLHVAGPSGRQPVVVASGAAALGSR
jgi:hypothetical protein